MDIVTVALYGPVAAPLAGVVLALVLPRLVGAFTSVVAALAVLASGIVLAGHTVSGGTTSGALVRADALTAWLLLGLASCAGCYDPGALINEVRSAALRSRLVEVDLGSFRTTMPHPRNTSETTELQLHIFGTVPRYRVPDIEKQLQADGFRLRHETIAAVRQASREELAEPSLNQLRSRIEKVVNHILDDAPVKTIGFYDVRMRTR